MKNDKKKSGVTTKIVDRCVQEFFTKGLTHLYEGRDDKRRNDEVFEIFIQRIQNEHRGIKYTYSYGIFDEIHCWKVEIHNL